MFAWQLDEVRGATRDALPNFPPQAGTASGDVRKNGRRYRRRSWASFPGIQKGKKQQRRISVS